MAKSNNSLALLPRKDIENMARRAQKSLRQNTAKAVNFKQTATAVVGTIGGGALMGGLNGMWRKNARKKAAEKMAADPVEFTEDDAAKMEEEALTVGGFPLEVIVAGSLAGVGAVVGRFSKGAMAETAGAGLMHMGLGAGAYYAGTWMEDSALEEDDAGDEEVDE